MKALDEKKRRRGKEVVVSWLFRRGKEVEVKEEEIDKMREKWKKMAEKREKRRRKEEGEAEGSEEYSEEWGSSSTTDSSSEYGEFVKIDLVTKDDKMFETAISFFLC